jgi:ribonuclease Z
MRTLFHPSFVHPTAGEPGVWIDLPDEGRAVLIDLPSLTHLPARKLLKVAHAVVTHMHMDHFIGFDHLLRVVLRREAPLTITGPEGFLASARGRIGAYTWNLIGTYPVHLRIQEVAGDTLRAEEYTGESRMRPVTLPDVPFSGIVHAERAFRIEVATFDHGIPVLGVIVREARHLSVNKDALVRRGFAAGAWLKELKEAMRRGAGSHTPIDAIRTDGSLESCALGDLAGGVIVEAPGQVVAYLTDLAGTDENLELAARFVRGANLLLCEAAFLDVDRALALERRHLTATQAGALARRAGAKQLAVFHLSPRYEGREAWLLREAAESFGAPLARNGGAVPL